MVPDHELQLVLRRRIVHNHRGHVVVHVLLRVILGVGPNAAVTAHYEIPFDGLHQGQWVDLDGAPLPLLEVRAARMSLEVALEW